MDIIKERIFICRSKIRIDTPDGKVHHRHFPGSRIAFLAINRQIVNVALVTLDELGRLHEHPATSTARVVYAPVIGLDNLDERLHDTRRRVEFASVLSLGFGKLAQAVLISSTKNIPRIAFLGHLNIGEKVHHIAKAALIQFLPGKVLGKDILELRIFGFDLTHGLV